MRVQLVKGMIALTIIFVISCGQSIYDGSSGNSTEKDFLNAARRNIDQKKYDDASHDLSQVKTESEEKTLLEAAVILGQSGLSMWNIILSVIDSLSSSTSTGSGIDQVFNLLSDAVFGTGEDRENSLSGLNLAIEKLANVQNPSSAATNLKCLLAGILVVPVVNDGTSALTAAVSSLESISTSFTGTGATSEECPGIENFNTALSQISTIQASLSTALDLASTCPMLSFLTQGSELNAVQQKLKKFQENADGGCDAGNSCTGDLCQVLNLGCISTLLNDSTAVAGDGVVNSCELVYNCQDPSSCF